MVMLGAGGPVGGSMVTRLLCLSLSLAASPALAAGTLVVQVRSNLRPGADFHGIRVSVHPPRGEADVARVESAVAAGDPFDSGARVAEIPLPKGAYRLAVSALDKRGAVLLERVGPIEITGGTQVVSVALSIPEAGSTRSGAGCRKAAAGTKRQCGRLMGACINEAKGEASRAQKCRRVHTSCLRAADYALEQCLTTSPAPVAAPPGRNQMAPGVRR